MANSRLAELEAEKEDIIRRMRSGILRKSFGGHSQENRSYEEMSLILRDIERDIQREKSQPGYQRRLSYFVVMRIGD